MSAAQIPEPGEELVYLLPGFSTQSGIRVGEIFEEDVESADGSSVPNDIPSPIVFQPAVPGNRSEFSICLRIKAHYQRPETILVTAFVENKTALVIGRTIELVSHF